jgi:glucose-6-phosphate 1-dehydrogenase
MKLFIFGSTGDLVKRKVLSSLKLLEKDLEIFAIGRKDLDSESYQNFMCGGNCQLGKRLEYIKIDFDKEYVFDLEKYLDKHSDNFFYISLVPEMIQEVLSNLLELRKLGYSMKILIEKPFGRNFDEARSLYEFILKNNLEEDIFLSDHYLFKDSIINLKKQKVSKLKIVSLESLGVEGRIYYDSVGALKDMVQGHFLNIVSKSCFNFTEEFENFQITEFKRGQYKGYENEIGKDSLTETFVKLILKTKNAEFEFITGKGFEKKISFLEIDGKKIDLESKHEYVNLFEKFLHKEKSFFSSLNETLFNWKLVEFIERKIPSLFFYKKGTKIEEILK